ncbi:uncharacterized protein AMSG_05320 [Thecamonas trahens ATCC 50062]|uniref:A-kinase anchor protein 7-like phosphoesterase domain-containing protein n=1 Tax=Thecamonas trahens ATCC 50062 TaxID=461836 RepID=A0A0L0DAF1_THETB|nr:hypothetical protein AMSG_05320 [Thecamonas trahens ATCC 50062]KNC49322.1 hypothetical protein AMSG_05320 [Thecamonas trahens ATCC 50062]|eukprot:XP_013758030.1 hypothetical protein AMSG_05320 [Thecamonas trahens ATCC 50062]
MSKVSGDGKRKSGEDGRTGKGKAAGAASRGRQRQESADHFVSIRIDDVVALDGLRKVQEAVVAIEPEAAPTLIAIPKIHLTLCVLRLGRGDEPAGIAAARRILDAAAPGIQAVMAKLRDAADGVQPAIRLAGLESFRNGQVLFAQVPPWARAATLAHSSLTNVDVIGALQEIAADLHARFDAEGLAFPPQQPWAGFTPHCTLAKSRTSVKARPALCRAVPRVTQSITVFGDQDLVALDLCRMEAVDDDGYYATRASISLLHSESKPPAVMSARAAVASALPLVLEPGVASHADVV